MRKICRILLTAMVLQVIQPFNIAVGQSDEPDGQRSFTRYSRENSINGVRVAVGAELLYKVNISEYLPLMVAIINHSNAEIWFDLASFRLKSEGHEAIEALQFMTVRKSAAEYSRNWRLATTSHFFQADLGATYGVPPGFYPMPGNIYRRRVHLRTDAAYRDLLYFPLDKIRNKSSQCNLSVNLHGEISVHMVVPVVLPDDMRAESQFPVAAGTEEDHPKRTALEKREEGHDQGQRF